jgi:uncharacterized protein YprB with RNaseH-like and TPR domain
MSSDLDRLRRKITRIDRKWRDGPAAAAAEEQRQWRSRAGRGPQLPGAPGLAPQGIEELVSGAVVEFGGATCFRTSRTYAFHRRHGNAEISALAEMNGAPLGVHFPPVRWAFLDTETTGLAGGTGTYCFLIGVGSVEGRDFCVDQFLMRDYAEEPALLDALAEHLARFDVLVTYNGKTFDAPLLETRYRLARRCPALARLAHIDLLHSARRLFRLRLSSCRLVELEGAVLGFEREGDLAGELIPYYYFDYLRTHNALKIVPILHHNFMDIVTLACLTALVLSAAGDPEAAPLAHPLDLYSLAAWVAKVGNHEPARRLYQRALAAGLPEAIDWRARAELAALHKRARDYQQAAAIWNDLSTGPPQVRLPAIEELSKYYEHRLRDYSRAWESARLGLAAALLPEDALAWQRRVARLERKLARSPLFC